MFELIGNLPYVRLCDLDMPREKMAKLFANSGDPDQMLHTATSDLGLHCLPYPFRGLCVEVLRPSQLNQGNGL